MNTIDEKGKEREEAFEKMYREKKRRKNSEKKIFPFLVTTNGCIA